MTVQRGLAELARDMQGRSRELQSACCKNMYKLCSLLAFQSYTAPKVMRTGFSKLHQLLCILTELRKTHLET